MKPIRLTQSEIDNAQKTSDGKSYTVVVRPQAKGGFLVAMVDVATGEPKQVEEVDSKKGVPDAVREVNRWMDKLGFLPDKGPGMFDKSRFRKQQKEASMKTNVRVAKALMALAKELIAGAYTQKMDLDEVKRDMEHASIRALDAVLSLGPKAKLVREAFLVFSEGASHKFHFFALYDDGGTMKAGNAYGRIGGNVTAIKIGEGRMAESAYYDKLRKKRNKGYEQV